MVADYIEDERQLKYTVHMAHSAGCSAEAKLDIDSAILNQAGELKKIVENTGIDGIFLTGEAPKNNSAEKQMAWINQIKEIEEKVKSHCLTEANPQCAADCWLLWQCR